MRGQRVQHPTRQLPGAEVSSRDAGTLDDNIFRARASPLPSPPAETCNKSNMGREPLMRTGGDGQASGCLDLTIVSSQETRNMRRRIAIELPTRYLCSPCYLGNNCWSPSPQASPRRAQRPLAASRMKVPCCCPCRHAMPFLKPQHPAENSRMELGNGNCERFKLLMRCPVQRCRRQVRIHTGPRHISQGYPSARRTDWRAEGSNQACFYFSLALICHPSGDASARTRDLQTSICTVCSVVLLAQSLLSVADPPSETHMRAM
jgi:hypothetical protein